jgi:alpha-tubulin suppressor-like RCC1 family protein
MALTEDGRIFSWGDNGSGQLGRKPVLGEYMAEEVVLREREEGRW